MSPASILVIVFGAAFILIGLCALFFTYRNPQAIRVGVCSTFFGIFLIGGIIYVEKAEREREIRDGEVPAEIIEVQPE